MRLPFGKIQDRFCKNPVRPYKISQNMPLRKGKRFILGTFLETYMQTSFLSNQVSTLKLKHENLWEPTCIGVGEFNVDTFVNETEPCA